MRYLSQGSQDPVTYMEVTETVGRFTPRQPAGWQAGRLAGTAAQMVFKAHYASGLGNPNPDFMKTRAETRSSVS